MPASVVVTPHPEWRAETATVAQGSSLIVNGGGYQPGQEVMIGMGVAQTDSFVMDDQVAVADAGGGFYSFTITIGADLPPKTYAVLTYVTEHGRSGPEFEATKRYAVIDVVAP